MHSMKSNELFEHYKKNKKIISERLQEFARQKDEKELFLELCFCLLAANTSSRMASRVMDQVGDVIFTGTEKEIRDKLHSLHCRFYRMRSQYISLARDVPLNPDREYLVKNIKGFGYKESSHFLRNTGHKGHAILDKHILRSLVEFHVIPEIPTSLNKQRYLEIEEKMKAWSKKIGIPMDELDLVLWSRKTGEVLK